MFSSWIFNTVFPMRLGIIFLIFFLCSLNALLMGQESHKNSLAEEEERLMKLYREYAKFYEMPDSVDMRDITQEVLQSPFVQDAQKQSIQDFNRRILVFTYPSDGLKIKGLVSFVPDPQNHPLLVFLRGGTGIFGVVNPGSDLVCPEQYTVISTIYRGGVSEGKDEYGGDDVNDVENLIRFIPELENKLGLSFQNKESFLLGSSRGGMQMFLALACFPDLQNRFSKVISLCGLLDMRECIAARPDMEDFFTKEFGLKKGINDDEWIDKRNPILTVSHIIQELPILIIQGTDDHRVTLQEGYNMVNTLQSAGKNVTYLEVEGGKHCLNNFPDRMQLILNWIEYKPL